MVTSQPAAEAPLPPPSDDKDWTWVLQRPCPDCGFDAAQVRVDALPEQIREAGARFVAALDRPDAAQRPDPQTWSVIEYGQHVADVCEVMTQRLELILSDGGPDRGPVQFANWDQDATALQKEYWKASASVTAVLVRERSEAAAEAWARPSGDEWSWTALRSNGSEFTAESLGQYFLHDLHHHLKDVNA